MVLGSYQMHRLDPAGKRLGLLDAFFGPLKLSTPGAAPAPASPEGSTQ